MFDILWDLHQQRRINGVEGEISEARRGVLDVRQELRDLRTTLEQMSLANHAMWELVRERLQLSDQELINRMQEIDLRDGVRDGRVTKQAVPRNCPNCNRRLATKHERCIYCGQNNPNYQPFEVK